MRILIAYSFIFLFLLISTVASAQEFRDEWYQCQKDEECVVVCGYCGFEWAINKNSSEEVSKIVSKWTVCQKSKVCTSSKINPSITAKCIDNKCEIMWPDKEQ